MKGIDLAKEYYLECFQEILEKDFPEEYRKIAVGLVGSGSECYGFDDEISCDHDFEPGFCVFIPESVDEKTELNLRRAYNNMPREFKGYERNTLAAAGGNRHGILRTRDFYINKIGSPNGDFSLLDWFNIPESFLFEATNGEVFIDNLGEFTKIREKISNPPKDVLLKKLAGNLLTMEQSGRYNFERCLKRNETAAAQLSLFEFTKAAMNCVFILNKKYVPYYKWCFRALRSLDLLSSTADSLEFLISTDNTPQNAEIKMSIIEDTAYDILLEVKKQYPSKYDGEDLDKLAYGINNLIEDNDLRNRNILYGV